MRVSKPKGWSAGVAMRRVSGEMVALACVGFAAAALGAPESSVASEWTGLIHETRQKVVKIHGAGGFVGLEPYQSGILISPGGHILTCWSTVLDADSVMVVLDDGRRFEAELLGADPATEVAVLKIEAEDMPCFSLSEGVSASPGTRILAFSNLFGVATGSEPVSVQRGIVSTITTLEARRGVFETSYRGDVYVLDAVTNNPGAAGGVIVDLQGRLLGMLGKELRNSINDTWINYAIPAKTLHSAVGAIVSGVSGEKPPTTPATVLLPTRPWTLERAGMMLLPNVLDRTPPFIDWVFPTSPASLAGLKADDMVLYVQGRLARSRDDVESILKEVDAEQPLKITVLRDHQIVEMSLQPSPGARP